MKRHTYGKIITKRTNLRIARLVFSAEPYLPHKGTINIDTHKPDEDKETRMGNEKLPREFIKRKANTITKQGQRGDFWMKKKNAYRSAEKLAAAFSTLIMS